ncbi:carboxylesterase/lipase family protein [Steroidobacter sp.]|uniref:carboxylesterase/lipase family protein n=1 Tax=Steroidobacter sp. TaxID=1978227 RepID=UPI001A5FA487|nr:carboxylesterase family protein [Steroidobacter sp.]MBL8265943.1 carboxylesterase family protein [Steroidobacter sp.]
MRALQCLVATAIVSLTWSAQASTKPEQARIDSGELAGVVADDIVSFKGIPYAAPPVGKLRWRAPQPVAAWRGVRKADQVGALCSQKINTTDNGVGPPPASEDCLTLNVFAPTVRPKQLLPVMFWIHGGGFVNGSGTAALYDGTELAKQGVVVVTINYRLGRLGFFAHPALVKEAPKELQGNYALLDQIAALHWVKRNIAAFGGDAGNVTIFGESAGGAAVNALMIAPPARGLFHKAISQSGLGRDRRLFLDRKAPDGRASALEEGAKFAAKLGVANGDLAALRALSAETIVNATEQFAETNPIIDGKLLLENVDVAFAAGRQAPVPYLAGSNALEFAFYSESLPGALGEAMRFPAEQRAQLVSAYGGEDNFKANVLSDVLFTEAARELTRLHAKAKHPAYLYRFSVLSEHAPPTVKATPHAQERQHVFKTLETSPWKTDANDERAANLISAYWVAFAKTGNPNGGGRPEWPLASGDNRVFEFGNGGPIVTQQPHAAALDLIAKRY